MNRLRAESSPYLRQHAANPVDWYPWGEEALGRARRENKPILLSIGYSTCHWCHVMARESFADPEAAALMNEYFINIKVDREDRPDLDQLYMDACEVLTGTGGWPLNVFLTPDLRPFYAGTYFPPQPGYRRQSWLQALEYAAYNFYENREAVDRQADRVMHALETSERRIAAALPETKGPDHAFSTAFADELYQSLIRKFDPEQGGFNQAPKFPNTMALEFLLHYAWHTGRGEPREQALFSLRQMLRGGIYDQLGGGLCRYATDREWLAPHFEKMLYDNALLIQLLADAYRLTRDEEFREKLLHAIAFVERELTSPQGGFYAALDAETEGEEGKFYTWTLAEWRALLGKDAEWSAGFFGLTPEGNWENGNNVLHQTDSIAAFAESRGEDQAKLRERLAAVRETLFAARSQRTYPHRDEKMVLGWNALMVTAYAKAFSALGEQHYREKAIRHLGFLLDTFREPDGRRLHHRCVDGKAGIPAYLNDYAFLIDALLAVYAITFDADYLDTAGRLTEYALAHYYDPSAGLFFFSAQEQTELVLRRKEVYDNDMPSGNATMLRNLQRLGLLLGREAWRSQAAAGLRVMRESLRDDPFPLAHWATVVLAEIFGIPEIAVVGPQAHEQAAAIRSEFLPSHVIMAAPEADETYPLLAHRNAGDDTFIYLCRDYACQRPVTTPGAFRDLLTGQTA